MKKVIPKRKPLELAECEFLDPRGVQAVELLRLELAKVMGVTVIGSQLTMRFSCGAHFFEITSVVVGITDDSVLEELDYENK